MFVCVYTHIHIYLCVCVSVCVCVCAVMLADFSWPCRVMVFVLCLCFAADEWFGQSDKKKQTIGAMRRRNSFSSGGKKTLLCISH